MKLIIQIPCYNEENTLPLVLKELPKQIDGVDEIKIQIINDGSTDRTEEIARELGVDYIVSYVGNKGLGFAFKKGVENALKNGADMLVNTDGDNQYPGKYIPELIRPILEKKADIVIANRQTDKIKHFSKTKKILQKIGSSLVRFLSGTKVSDTVSGYRAYSREAMLQINIVSRFSYVLDSIIQAGKKGVKIAEIDIETNPPTRKSRLFKNIRQHIKRSTIDMFRVYTMYEPLKAFIFISIPFFVVGFFGVGRFLYFYTLNPIDTGLVQSVILSGVSLLVGLQFVGMGIVGDLIAKSRIIKEDELYMQKKIYYNIKD